MAENIKTISKSSADQTSNINSHISQRTSNLNNNSAADQNIEKENKDLLRIKEKLEQAGITPHEAKHWKKEN